MNTVPIYSLYCPVLYTPLFPTKSMDRFISKDLGFRGSRLRGTSLSPLPATANSPTAPTLKSLKSYLALATYTFCFVHVEDTRQEYMYPAHQVGRVCGSRSPFLRPLNLPGGSAKSRELEGVDAARGPAGV